MRAFPFIVLALAILAGIAGWLTTPRYRAPGDSGDDRLRQRAVAYYRASRLLDFEGMSRLFTPARQESQTDYLRDNIREKRETYNSLSQSTRDDLQFSADSISPDRLTLKVDGDWAVTSGTCDMRMDGDPVRAPLADIVWVRNAGEWWVYSLTNEELNAYGNPPDFARKTFELRDPMMVEQDKP